MNIRTCSKPATAGRATPPDKGTSEAPPVECRDLGAFWAEGCVTCGSKREHAESAEISLAPSARLRRARKRMWLDSTAEVQVELGFQVVIEVPFTPHPTDKVDHLVGSPMSGSCDQPERTIAGRNKFEQTWIRNLWGYFFHTGTQHEINF